MDSRINSRIIEANVKLQDENKLLKEDKEILKRRIEKAIEFMEEDYINGKCNGLTWIEARQLLNILKGEYVKEEK